MNLLAFVNKCNNKQGYKHIVINVDEDELKLFCITYKHIETNINSSLKEGVNWKWNTRVRGWEGTNNDAHANEVLQTTLVTIRPKAWKVKEERDKHH
jgi:hypothetical protein